MAMAICCECTVLDDFGRELPCVYVHFACMTDMIKKYYLQKFSFYHGTSLPRSVSLKDMKTWYWKMCHMHARYYTELRSSKLNWMELYKWGLRKIFAHIFSCMCSPVFSELLRLKHTMPYGMVTTWYYSLYLYVFHSLPNLFMFFARLMDTI